MTKEYISRTGGLALLGDYFPSNTFVDGGVGVVCWVFLRFNDLICFVSAKQLFQTSWLSPLDIHSRECLGKAKSGKVPGNPLLLHSWMSSQLYELLSICGICLNNVGMQNYLPSLSILFLREGTFSPIGSASPAVFCIVPKWPNLGNHTAEKFIDKKDKYYSEYNGPINGRLCWIIWRQDSFFYIKNSFQFGRACSVFCTLVDFRCWILDTLWWNGDLLWF